jgi:hypothetical protein
MIEMFIMYLSTLQRRNEIHFSHFAVFKRCPPSTPLHFGGAKHENCRLAAKPQGHTLIVYPLHWLKDICSHINPLSHILITACTREIIACIIQRQRYLLSFTACGLAGGAQLRSPLTNPQQQGFRFRLSGTCVCV